MDETRLLLFERFKRSGAVYIMVPAVLVAVLVSFGVRYIQTETLGRLIGTGLNGFAAVSVRDVSRLTDPEVVAKLRADLIELAAQGSFHCVTVVSTEGDIITTTEDGPCLLVTAGLEQTPEAFAEGRIHTSIEPGAEAREILVVAPLRRSGDAKPYAAIIATRPYALFAGGLNGTTIAIILTVMIGAAAAYLMLRYLVHQAEQEIERQSHLVDALNRRLGISLHDLEEQSLGTLQALVAAVDAKDAYTARHSLNVADYGCTLASRLGRDDLVPLIEKAGLLHDIGKIGVAESALAKPGRLTVGEYESVQDHSRAGAEIIKMIPFLGDVVPLVMYHHERFDGTGYPSRLAGESIPLAARILAVADAFDAMTTERSYQRARTRAEAVRELIRCRGTQFDPAMVDAFVEAIDDGSVRWRGDRPKHNA